MVECWRKGGIQQETYGRWRQSPTDRQTCHPDGQLASRPPDPPHLGRRHQWVSNACLPVKIVTPVPGAGSGPTFSCSGTQPRQSLSQTYFRLWEGGGGGKESQRQFGFESLVRIQSSSICIRMSLKPALVHVKKGWGRKEP